MKTDEIRKGIDRLEMEQIPGFRGKSEIKVRANNRWQWIEGLLRAAGIEDSLPLEVVEYLYKNGVDLGAKHAKD